MIFKKIDYGGVMQGFKTILEYRQWCEARGLRACLLSSLRLYNSVMRGVKA